MVKNLPANAGDTGEVGSIPGLGRFPGEGKGYPLQYSGLENSMDYIVHGVTKSQTLPNSNDHYIYYCGQESLIRNGVAIMVNKRVQNAVLGCNLKSDRMISVRFQGKPFNITVIQAYAPTSNAKEAEVEQFYEDLQDLLELTPKKKKMSFSS